MWAPKNKKAQTQESRCRVQFLFTKPPVHKNPTFPRKCLKEWELIHPQWNCAQYFHIFCISAEKEKEKKNQEAFFLIRTQGDSLTFSTPEAMMVRIFRSKQLLPPPLSPNEAVGSQSEWNQPIDYREGRDLRRGAAKNAFPVSISTSPCFHLVISVWQKLVCLCTAAAESGTEGGGGLGVGSKCKIKAVLPRAQLIL